MGSNGHSQHVDKVIERVSGLDATMWHLETREAPMHTLKVIVLGPSTQTLELADLKGFLAPRLGYAPRLTQVVAEPLVLRARPFWVPVEIDLDAHVTEVTLVQPGSQRQLDDLCARLAETHLPRHRPLWAATLVHGLSDGRQAIVLRLHHAIADGLASMNLFLSLTTREPGDYVPEKPALPALTATDVPTSAALTKRVVKDAASLLLDVPTLARATQSARRAVAELEHAAHDVPKLLRAPRTSFSPHSGAERVCASVELPVASLKALAKGTGTTLNGVLHAVMAGAIRDELAQRGDRLDHPTVAIYGVACDTETQRTWGNEIATASVYLRSDIADPLERLRATARSCRVGVERRRAKGFAHAMRLKDYGTRLGPRARPLAKNLLPVVVNHVTTANVPGPQHTRYLGQIPVSAWISYAVAVSPADVNITAHSYDGRMAIGMVATPEAMPDAHGFLARFSSALATLEAAMEETELGSHPGARFDAQIGEVDDDADGNAA